MDFTDLMPAKYLYEGFKTHVDPAIEEWLYGDWNEEKYHQYMLLSRVPVVGEYLDYKLDLRADKEYLTRYGMDYTDIHDPRKLRATSSGSALVSSSFNMISKNIDKLYH